MTSAHRKPKHQNNLNLEPGRNNSGDSTLVPDELFVPRFLVSGGQTGVDRAALDFAIEHGLEHAGWCPAGRVAEDGTIPEKYQLDETDSGDYSVRTEKNVVNSDGTLVLYHAIMSGGTKLTTRFARRYFRPLMTVDLDSADLNAEINRCKLWLRDVRPTRLNVAGPRESNVPGIYNQTIEFLRSLFSGE